MKRITGLRAIVAAIGVFSALPAMADTLTYEISQYFSPRNVSVFGREAPTSSDFLLSGTMTFDTDTYALVDFDLTSLVPNNGPTGPSMENKATRYTKATSVVSQYNVGTNGSNVNVELTSEYGPLLDFSDSKQILPVGNSGINQQFKSTLYLTLRSPFSGDPLTYLSQSENLWEYVQTPGIIFPNWFTAQYIAYGTNASVHNGQGATPGLLAQQPPVSQTPAVPLPAGGVLLVTGLAALALRKRRT